MLMSLRKCLAATLLAGILFNAKDIKAQAQFGVRAGANFFNAAIKDMSGTKVKDYSLNPGFHLGVTVDVAMASDFSLQPGLLFYTKGFQGEFITPTVTTATTATAFYAEIPVNVIYKPEVGNGRLLLGAGPYLGYGLGGNFTRTVKTWNEIEGVGSVITSQKDELKLEFVNNVADKANSKVHYGKPLDFGGNLLAGYELKNGLSAQLNAQLGLANIAADGDTYSSSIKNLGFGISLGYKF